MNKDKLVRGVIKVFPAGSFARKAYNKKKYDVNIKRYMDKAEAEAAEKNGELKVKAVEKFKAELPSIAKKTEQAIERQISRTPSYKGRENDEKLRLEMMFCKYAYGFEPDEFLCYGLEGKSGEERKEYVSDRDLMCYVYRMNDRIDFMVFNDKAETYSFFKKFYHREVAAISSEKDYPEFEKYVKAHPVFVKKHVFEAMGRSIELVDSQKCGKNTRELFDEYIAGGKFIVEEKVQQSSKLAVFNESSVNTMRCITYNTKNGIVVPYCFMKIGRRGSFVDNGGAGGILAGIDNDTGIINTDGFDEFNTRYICHPDSEVDFKGYQIPDFKQAVEISKKMSAMIPSVRFIGWDLAHTEKGWVVIEGNGMSQLIGPQIVWEHGVKSEVEKIISDMDLIL